MDVTNVLVLIAILKPFWFYYIAAFCPDAYCDENNILRGARPTWIEPKYDIPWSDLSEEEQKKKAYIGHGIESNA